MKTNVKKLTEKESEIMERLWRLGPQTIRELLSDYPDPKPHFNTVATIVRVLMGKGFVEHTGERNGAFTYGAIVKPDAFRSLSLSNLVKSYFNNNYCSVVSELIKDEKISVEELREIINMVEPPKNK